MRAFSKNVRCLRIGIEDNADPLGMGYLTIDRCSRQEITLAPNARLERKALDLPNPLSNEVGGCGGVGTNS